MDLLALADALLLPDDDLALATVLKSPLFGLDEDALFGLAWQRAGTLRQALRAKAAAHPGLADAAARLRGLRAERHRHDSLVPVDDREPAARRHLFHNWIHQH